MQFLAPIHSGVQFFMDLLIPAKQFLDYWSRMYRVCDLCQTPFLLGTIIISLPMYATTINSAVPHFITLTTMSPITVKVACRVHVAYFKE